MKTLSLFLIIQLSCLLLFSQEPKLMLPIGLTGKSYKASYAFGGKNIVTISADGTAQIWDAASAMLLANLVMYF